MTEGILHAEDEDESAGSLLRITMKAIEVFLASRQGNGLIGGIGYWQVANGYTAIALHDKYSGTNAHLSDLRQLLAAVELNQPGYINEFNDDSMWWAHMMLEMYDLTLDRTYLAKAQSIHTHVKRSLILPKDEIYFDGKDMEGGVLWTTRKNETQVNSITTGLFAELSARLALYFPHQRQWMLDRAIRSLFWIMRCRYDEEKHMVLDTINLGTQEYIDWAFTYTTGQTIAAAVAVFEATRGHHKSHESPSALRFLDIACELAHHAMHQSEWVDEDLTLTAPNEYPGKDNKPAWQNDDAVGFKSVLLRSLVKLYRTLEAEDLSHHLRRSIRGFIYQQFHSLQTRDTNGRGQYGPWWAGPRDLYTSHSQLAVLDVMAGIHAVRRKTS